MLSPPPRITAARPDVNHVVFDFDGTLVDSLPGIALSLRAALEQYAEVETVPDLRPFIGPPIGRMIQALWPHLPAEVYERVLREFCLHYDTQGCLLSVPYPGVDTTLSRLHRNGLTLYVVTNKRLAPTETVVRALGWNVLFAELVTPDGQTPRYPSKTEACWAFAQRRGLQGPACVMVGDSADDLVAAARCGFTFVHAAYGYGGPVSTDYAIDGFADIERFVGRRFSPRSTGTAS
jgi:phosphoglycolate phosphatase